LNIRDLEYLVAVHDVSNFSKAAQICNVSQPTLSGQLKKLETDLDVSLIERSTRRVLFTPIGESVVAHARNVLNTVEQIQGLTKNNNEPMVGDFHIGLIPTVGPFLLPKLMPELNNQFPKMNLYLYELQTEKLIEKLLKGELDAIILAKLDWNYPVDETKLYTEKMLLAVSSEDELAKEAGSVNRNVMAGRSMLMLEDGHCLRDQAMGVCFDAGANEDHRFKATSMDTLLHMVVSGTGMTLVPQLACNKSMEGVTFLTFKNPKPRRDIVMLTRKKCVRKQSFNTLAKVINKTVEPHLN